MSSPTTTLYVETKNKNKTIPNENIVFLVRDQINEEIKQQYKKHNIQEKTEGRIPMVLNQAKISDIRLSNFADTAIYHFNCFLFTDKENDWSDNFTHIDFGKKYVKEGEKIHFQPRHLRYIAENNHDAGLYMDIKKDSQYGSLSWVANPISDEILEKIGLKLRKEFNMDVSIYYEKEDRIFHIHNKNKKTMKPK